MTNSDRLFKDDDTAHIESILEPVMTDIPADLGIEEEGLPLAPKDLGIEVQEINPAPMDYGAWAKGAVNTEPPLQTEPTDYAQGLHELNGALLRFQQALVPMAASPETLRKAAQAAYGAVVIALGDL